MVTFRSVLKQSVLKIIDPIYFRGVRIIWMGDSHSAPLHNYTTKISNSISSVASLQIWLGSRLMHSISEKGFQLSKPMLYLLKLWNADYLFFVLGEIDCRMYLSEELHGYERDLEWVRKYVHNCVQLGRTLSTPRLFLLAPIPASDLGSSDGQFPRRGSIESRVNATHWLSNSLEVIAKEGNLAIDFISMPIMLYSPNGSLCDSFTSDGVHLNELGTQVLWEHIVDYFN